MAAINPPIKNQLLAALINSEYQHLVPHLEPVDMVLGDVIYFQGGNIEHVYFPETSAVSLLSTMESGSTTEVGLVGREGMLGLTVFLGGALTPEQALVQMAGSAMRMKATVLRDELKMGSPLQMLLLRYTRSFLLLISQSVACSQHHSLEQRYARWLLMMHNYSESNRLRLTHEMISSMIGTRRAGVTVASLALKERKLIDAGRGWVQILDRLGLEATACECYEIIRDEFSRLHNSQLAANPLHN